MSNLYEFRIRRVKRSFAHEGKKICGPLDAIPLLQRLAKDQHREHFWAIYLDTRGVMIGFEEIAVGTPTSVEVLPSELFRGAILSGASSVIVAHNHPSGDPEPSEDDKELTVRLIKAGEVVGIQILDHLIVANQQFASLVALGYFE